MVRGTPKTDPYLILAGVLVILAIMAATAFLVALLIHTSPTAAVAVLTGFAAILSAVPPIIRALRGDGNARSR